MTDSDKIIVNLENKVINLSKNKSDDIEKLCWMVVHEYRHGMLPSEYDIREIDEDLYLMLLKRIKNRS